MFFTPFLFAQNSENEPVLRSGTRLIMEEALKDPEKKLILDQLEIFTEDFIANMDNHRMGGHIFSQLLFMLFIIMGTKILVTNKLIMHCQDLTKIFKV